MVNLEVERLRIGSLDHGDVAPSPLVGFGQRIGAPVCPVNLAAVHGDSEGMGQVLMPPQNLNQP